MATTPDNQRTRTNLGFSRIMTQSVANRQNWAVATQRKWREVKNRVDSFFEEEINRLNEE